MFRKIAVAYDESPEAQRAFREALRLAKGTSAELAIITVVEELPAYVSYVAAVAPGVPALLKSERLSFYEDLQKTAKLEAEQAGVALHAELTEGDETGALLHVVEKLAPDLLVIGLKHKSSDLRLMGGTTYHIAQHARCNILGVH